MEKKGFGLIIKKFNFYGDDNIIWVFTENGESNYFMIIVKGKRTRTLFSVIYE